MQHQVVTAGSGWLRQRAIAQTDLSIRNDQLTFEMATHTQSVTSGACAVVHSFCDIAKGARDEAGGGESSGGDVECSWCKA